MSLLDAGYWPTTYWCDSYWHDDYWQLWDVPAEDLHSSLRYASNETATILDTFPPCSTVVIDIYRVSDEEKLVDAAACNEIGTTGIFVYEYKPEDYVLTAYVWKMNDGSTTSCGLLLHGGYSDIDIFNMAEGGARIAEANQDYLKLLKKERWNKKILTKDAGLKYTEVTYDDDDTTEIRNQELIKDSPTEETRTKSTV